MYGLIGKKIKMSQIFNADGHVVPVTLVQAGPCVISQIKTSDTDGYNSVQLAFGKKSKRNTTKPAAGHLKKAEIESAQVLAEFQSLETFEYKLGQKFDSSISITFHTIELFIFKFELFSNKTPSPELLCVAVL